MDLLDGFVSLCLCPFCYVVVDIPGYLAGFMPQPAGNDFQINIGFRHQSNVGMTQNMRRDFPPQDPQRSFLEILIICRIVNMFTVQITEEKGASAAVPEVFCEGKGVDLPAQVE